MGAVRAMLMSNRTEHGAAALHQSFEPTIEEARLRQQAIGVKLRQMFDEVVNEPIPDDFLDILRQADQKQAASKATGGRTEG